MNNDASANNPPDKLDQLVAAVAELNQTVKVIEVRQASMETQLTSMDARQASMETQLTNMDARQNSMEQGIINLGTRSEALENRVEALQHQLTDFSNSTQEQLTSMSSDIRKLDRKFDLLNEEVMEVRRDQRDLSRRQDNIEKKFS